MIKKRRKYIELEWFGRKPLNWDKQLEFIKEKKGGYNLREAAVVEFLAR
jgi:hypothetical protein